MKSMILEKFKNKKAGIFIDEGNVFYSQKLLGWHVHWRKFLGYISQFMEVKIARYYMGMPLEEKAKEQNIVIKHRLSKEGFDIITKPLKKIFINSKKTEFKNKCNFDVDITRDVIRNLDEIDVIIIVSGDSDFIGLRDDVLKYGKGFVFACFEHNVCWEIRKSYHLFFEDIKETIEYKKNLAKSEMK